MIDSIGPPQGPFQHPRTPMSFPLSPLSRREVLRNLSAAMALWSTPLGLVRADETHKFRSDPFLLGVASGNGTSQSVVLWTRLLDSLEERGRTLEKVGVPVLWEIADDE